MVANLMKWVPWAPSSSRRYEVKITIYRLQGLVGSPEQQESSSFCVEIQWKASKGTALSSLMSRSLRRNFTREEMLREDGVVYWDEEFHCVCNLLAYKDGLLHPREVSFTVHPGSRQGANNNILVGASASLNLADFTPPSNKQDTEISIPLSIPGTTVSLNVSITLLELRTAEERMPKLILLLPLPRLASPIRMDIFKGLSGLRARTSHEYSSDGRSSESQLSSSRDSDSFDASDEDGSEEMKEGDSCIRKSFNYGTLAYANHAGASSCSEDEDLVYYSHRRSYGGNIYPTAAAAVPVVNNPPQKNLKRRLLPWSRRKFASPVLKGEPLLKKYSGEEGGDDIDFDRRQLSSSQESNLISDQRSRGESSPAERPCASEFGDDNFAVGIWEDKEITSRDGQMKLKTQVFFASIDQRSERAAGESACTALVAVIADWFHENHDQRTPIKSQLDALIREGSLEWRKLCENESYGERFPDKHFDLETVLEAGIRPISVIPEKSFIGFFHPEQVDEEEGLDFLKGAMSFDSIWDEIRVSASEITPTGSPVVYIISWNDHFFILKVETDAYYIIDSLGERLHEGCDQAFVLKFDENTVIYRAGNKSHQNPDENDKTVDGSAGKQVSEAENIDDDPEKNIEDEGMIVCSGKESCKEYIKSFLAAIPIRELQVDLKKGLMASTPIHHRLQIECHYTTHCRNFH